MNSKIKWTILFVILLAGLWVMTYLIPLHSTNGDDGAPLTTVIGDFLGAIVNVAVVLSVPFMMLYCVVRFVKWAWHHD